MSMSHEEPGRSPIDEGAPKLDKQPPESSDSDSKVRLYRLTVGGCLLLFAAVLVRWWCPWDDWSPQIPPPPVWGPTSETDGERLKQEALGAVDRLVKVFPNSPDAWHSRALVHRRWEERDTAVDCWQRCLKLDPEFALAHYSLGYDLFGRGEYEASVASFEETLALDPRVETAHLLLARGLMKLGRNEEAITALEAYLRLVPRSAEGFFRLGQAHLELQQYEKAKERYHETLEANPDYVPAWEGLAAVSRQLGQQGEEERCRAKLKELKTSAPEQESLQPENPDDRKSLLASAALAHTDVGKVYYAFLYAEEAERHWLRAAELHPLDTVSRQMLVDSYSAQGRLDDALLILRQLAEIEPRNVLYFNNVGALSFQLGQIDLAEEAYRKVQQLAPQSHAGFAALAEVLLRTNRNIAEANELAKKAVELAPIAKNYYLLGSSHAQLGNGGEALEALQRAAELDVGNTVYRNAYEQVKSSQGSE